MSLGSYAEKRLDFHGPTPTAYQTNMMASKMEKQRETEKFVGCILSVKTKPGLQGEVKNLIGTVRDIDVESDEQAIILDDAMSNGVILPDGYVLMLVQFVQCSS